MKELGYYQGLNSQPHSSCACDELNNWKLSKICMWVTIFISRKREDSVFGDSSMLQNRILLKIGLCTKQQPCISQLAQVGDHYLFLIEIRLV